MLTVVNVNIITLLYFVTKQHLDRSSELLASGEPQLRRVEVRDRGTKGGDQWRNSDGQDDLPRVNLRLQRPHPGIKVYIIHLQQIIYVLQFSAKKMKKKNQPISILAYDCPLYIRIPNSINL